MTTGPLSFSIAVADSQGQRVSRGYSLTSYPPEVITTELTPTDLVISTIELGQSVFKSVQIKTSSSNPASFQSTVSYDGTAGWLTATSTITASTSDVGLLTIQASPGVLPPGPYTGRVVINGPGVENVAIRVTMVVSKADRIIIPSPLGLTFTAVEGGPDPPGQQVTVVNAGTGLLTWSVGSLTLSGGPWLETNPIGAVSEAGSVSGVFTIRAHPAGLTTGDYYGEVRINSTGALNTPQILTVVLRVRKPGDTADVVIRPAGLVLSDSATQEITLMNTGTQPVDFFTSGGDGQDLYDVSPATGALPPGTPVTVSIQKIASSGGLRRATLDFTFTNGVNKPVDVVLLAEGGGDVLPARASSGAQETVSARTTATAIVSCTPTQLVPISTLLGSGFSIPAGWPTPVEVRVVDDCGAPLNAGTVTVSFSNGDAPLNLVAVGDGRWSGTWIGRNALTPQVTVTVTAENPAARLRGTFQTTGGVEINSEPPVVASGGVVNAASLARQAPLAPGSFVTIFGSKLATATATSMGLPLDTTLGVTTVTLGGRLLPLQYASDGQVNAVVPYGIGLDAPQSLLIRRGTTLAVPEQIIVTSAQPGVFTRDQTGAGQGVVVDATYRYVDQVNPAVPGDVVTIFTTGLGNVTPNVEAGAAAPFDPLARTETPVTVTVGGLPADVRYAGLAPGLTGIYQVNIALPPGIPSSDAVPIVVSAAGRSSGPVTIATRTAR